MRVKSLILLIFCLITSGCWFKKEDSSAPKGNGSGYVGVTKKLAASENVPRVSNVDVLKDKKKDLPNQKTQENKQRSQSTIVKSTEPFDYVSPEVGKKVTTLDSNGLVWGKNRQDSHSALKKSLKPFEIDLEPDVSTDSLEKDIAENDSTTDNQVSSLKFNTHSSEISTVETTFERVSASSIVPTSETNSAMEKAVDSLAPWDPYQNDPYPNQTVLLLNKNANNVGYVDSAQKCRVLYPPPHVSVVAQVRALYSKESFSQGRPSNDGYSGVNFGKMDFTIEENIIFTNVHTTEQAYGEVRLLTQWSDAIRENATIAYSFTYKESQLIFSWWEYDLAINRELKVPFHPESDKEYYIALSRSGNEIKILVGGRELGKSAINNMDGGSRSLIISKYPDVYPTKVRITRGVGRYP